MCKQIGEIRNYGNDPIKSCSPGLVYPYFQSAWQICFILVLMENERLGYKPLVGPEIVPFLLLLLLVDCLIDLWWWSLSTYYRQQKSWIYLLKRIDIIIAQQSLPHPAMVVVVAFLRLERAVPRPPNGCTHTERTKCTQCAHLLLLFNKWCICRRKKRGEMFF